MDINYILISSPTLGMDSGVCCHGIKPYKVAIVQVWMFSDKWLLKYGLLENFNAKSNFLDMY